MGIELLEAGDMRSAITGWHGSRDLDQFVSAREVGGIDASVNELPTALFYFRDMMILERELVVTPRNHVIWARTSRVDDPRNFRAAAGFEQDGHRELKRIMQHLHDDGVHQDLWRMALPLCALTSWTTRLSYRDAVRLVCYFADVAQAVDVNNLKLSARLWETCIELQELLPAAYGVPSDVVGLAISSFKRMPIQPKLPDPMAPVLKHIDNATSITMHMPIALRAQLVRHREITISDNFVHWLNHPQSEQHNIGSNIVVQAVALNSTWSTVLGKRTCWMAQADLWKPLADLYGNGVDGLPCSHGTCPYAEDAKQRIAGNDPGAPCPRYASLTDTPMTQRQFSDAALLAERTGNPFFWRHVLEHAPLERNTNGDAIDTKSQCVHAQGCPFPDTCTAENHCDATFNGYR